ncbi:RNA polymerase sigma factor [Eremococcus coleocola]|uniref:RNA polymerase sigma factor, sigma-70 family n=1 Tax=Eremococcus coleocola ACS-139-V-Col8 TaxID=908337 RepID=E4KN84_9LACT|nr:sigma-70 family RNA polymerase sigma factor [Eremococcus coleocola]EFR31640.1 RNA polymerase sigma factor, sigma-70 family [Eremococcus coleocola ACS-139-V-Col8]
MPDQLLANYQALIYKTLNRLGISKNHCYYDDYYQELSLKLLALADSFQGDPLGEDRFRFTAYVQKGLYWYLLDLLKARPLKHEIAVEEIMTVKESLAQPDSRMVSHHRLMAFYGAVDRHLDESDRQLFYLLADSSFSMTEIAELLGISRKTLYKRKAKLQDQLGSYKFLLKEG